MGTRGAYGFIKNNVEKITYNHFDSYFEGLGQNIVDFVKNNSIDILNKIFDKIEMVRSYDEPTQQQIAECYRYADLTVSNKSYKDWYCLLRNTQGNLEFYKDDLRYMIDNKEFMGNSLFCEYAYIINLDTNELEFYLGFQKSPVNNRFAQYVTEDDNYYAVKKIISFKLDDIPDNWLDTVKEIEEKDYAENK